MAMKSSKIAVTLEPSLKQKLREYGKDNQIKNFSGVILAILDAYFKDTDSPSSPPTDLWQTIRELTARVEKLEGGVPTTGIPNEKPKTILNPKTSVKAVATKPVAKPKVAKVSSPVTSKVTKPAKPAKPAQSAQPAKPTKPVKKVVVAKTPVKTSTKSSATKTKTTQIVKSTTKAVPLTKSKVVSIRKSPKAKASQNQWMSTREAFDMYGGNLSWSRFSKLTPEELKERFNLDSDLSRKVRGSRFNQWLTLGK
jgi:outer membrane biosynthesis protein TonB